VQIAEIVRCQFICDHSIRLTFSHKSPLQSNYHRRILKTLIAEDPVSVHLMRYALAFAQATIKSLIAKDSVSVPVCKVVLIVQVYLINGLVLVRFHLHVINNLIIIFLC